MTGIEPANNEVTIHCLNHLATPAIVVYHDTIRLSDCFVNFKVLFTSYEK